MQPRTAVSIFGIENLYGGDFRRVIDVIRRADELGVDQMVMTDHVVMGERTKVLGPYLSFDDITCRPTHDQKGGIPLWFGIAPTEANCALVAELGAGWVPISQDAGVIRDGVAKFRAAFQRAGRDPKELQVRAHLPPKTSSSGAFDLEETLAAGVGPAVEAGATCIDLVAVLYCREPSDLDRALERIARIQL